MKNVVINNKKKRNFGLDLIRSAAILLVIISHTTFLAFPNKENIILTTIRAFGAIGVDLFFVLSGFLIGGILLQMLLDNKISFSRLFHFWKRRWLRIIPNYIVVLFINIGLVFYFNDYVKIDYLKYFFFLQNFCSEHPNFFTEAWSLSVEEYSYFVLPLILFSFINFKFYKIANSKKYLYITISLLFISFLIKIHFFINSTLINSYKDWSVAFRKVVVYRLDAIYFGFLFVYFFKKYQNHFLKNKNLYAFLGLAIFVLLHFYIALKQIQPQTNLAFYVFGYLQLVSLSVCLIFPFCIYIDNSNSFYKVIVEYLSKRSYAIYLVNYSIVLLTIQRFSQVFNNKIFLVVFYLIITLFFSEILYKFIELPILKYRNRVLSY